MEENDPSDAETLSSNSSYSDETWEDLPPSTDGEPEHGQDIQDYSGGPGGNCWYSLRKSKISSDKSTDSKSSLKEDSTVKTDRHPKRKVLIHKKLEFKSDRLDSSLDCSNSERANCQNDVNGRCLMENEASLEDSLFEPCQDSRLSYKTDSVSAWVSDQLKIQHGTGLCDGALYTGHSTLGGLSTTRNEVSDGAENHEAAATDMSLTGQSDISSDSAATYIVSDKKSMDDVDMVFHSGGSPPKQSVNSDDERVGVKHLQCSTSRRILRARKRFKSNPPTASMTERQLKEFFDSPCPDFTMLFPLSACDLSKNATGENNTVSEVETEASDSQSVSGGMRCTEVEKHFEGNVTNDSVTTLKPNQVFTNNVSDRTPQKECSLKPTKLEFLTTSINSKSQPRFSTGERNCSPRHVESNSSVLNTEEKESGCEARLKEISTDLTFVVSTPRVITTKRQESMLQQGATPRSLKKILDQMRETITANFNTSKISGQPYVKLMSGSHSDEDKNCFSSNCTMASDKEEASDENASTHSANAGNVCKKGEGVSGSGSHRPQEMSPVSRLSQLRLASPITSTKLTVVSSKKKHKRFQTRISLTNRKPSRIMISSLFSSCPKGTSSDVFPTYQNTRKAECQLETIAVKPHDQTVCLDRSPSRQQTTANGLSHKLPTPHRAASSIHSKPEPKHQVNRMTNNDGVQPSRVLANVMKRGLMQNNVHVKRLQKHTSTPVKHRFSQFKSTRFGLNDTLSTIAADMDIAVIEPS